MMKAYGGVLILAEVLFVLLKLLFYLGESIYRVFVPAEKNIGCEIVLITGAGSGIGREIALKYASLGATVVCWDLDQQENQGTVDRIKESGVNNVHGYACNVSNRDEVFKMATQVQQEVGNVTILINNAGVMPSCPLLQLEPEEIRRTFDVNVLAHFWTLQAFLPSMIQNNYGHVVALSSVAGIVGLRNLVPYCTSKFAIRGMMESLSEELRAANKNKPLNINFTTVYPYIVNTGMMKFLKIRLDYWIKGCRISWALLRRKGQLIK